MKILVAYYSYEGHSAFVAEALGNILNAELFRIETKDKKERKGLSKYFWGGKMVFSKKHPEIKEFNIDFSSYDLIVLGCPVWAGSPAPAMLSFLKEAHISEKNVAIFVCHLGGKGKSLEKFKEALTGNTITGEIDIINPNTADPDILSKWANEISKNTKL
jgi:flavodoxin